MAATQASGKQILANSIEAVDQAQMAALTIKGNNTGGASNEIDLSVAQVIAMLSVPSGSGANTRVAYWSGANTLTSDADFTFDGSQLALAVQGNTGGILIGGDALLYRSAADTLRTPDSLTVDGDLIVSSAFSTSDVTPVFGAYTLTVPATGTVALGTGTATYVAFWSGTNTLTGDSALVWVEGSAGSFPTSLTISGPTSSDTTVHVTGNQPIFKATTTVGAGDPKIWFDNGATSWGIGLDDSDSDALIIAYGASFGTNNWMRLAVGGEVTFEGAISTNANSNQFVFDANGSAPGVLTWSPTTSTKTITLPDETGTLPVGTGSNQQVAFWTGTNTLTSAAGLTFDGTQLAVPANGSSAGIIIGGDTQLYRSAANILRTPDSFTVDGTLSVQTATSLTDVGLFVANGFKITSAGGPRLDFNAADITFNATNAIITTGQWIGLGAAKGRLGFTDTTIDVLTVSDADFTVSRSHAAAVVNSQVYNSNSASATADAKVQIVTNGASSGDPFLQLVINSTIDWSIGLDNSDSDLFKIGTSTPGSATKFTLSSAGQATLPTTGSGAGLLIGGDAQIYRSAADVLRTPDSLTVDVGINIGVGFGATAGRINAAVSNAGAVGPSITLNNTGNAADDQAEFIFNSNGTNRAIVNFRVRSGGAGYINWFTGTAGSPSKKMELTENGLLDVAGPLRSTAQTAPTSGTGVELYYYVAGDYAELLSYNRTGSALKPLRLTGSNYNSEATSYTPTWRSTGTQPVVNNGTLTGYYVRHGAFVTCWIQLTIGSTTTLGTGTYEFDAPVAAATPPRFYIGSVQVLDTGVADYIGVARLDQTSTRIRGIMAAGNALGPAIPHAWNAGDIVAITCTYRV